MVRMITINIVVTVGVVVMLLFAEIAAAKHIATNLGLNSYRPVNTIKSI